MLNYHNPNVVAFAPENLWTLFNLCGRIEKNPLEDSLGNLELSHPLLRVTTDRNISQAGDIWIVVPSLEHRVLSSFEVSFSAHRASP